MEYRTKKSAQKERRDSIYSVLSISYSTQKGFTLVEMIVSIGLFTIILFIATSAFLTVVNTDRKSRSVRIATDNLNLTLEDMQRRIRTGSYYYCGTGGETTQVVSDTCLSNNSTISFTEQDGVTRTTYTWAINKITREHICLSSCGGDIIYGIPIDITAPEISIDGLEFIVKGSALGQSGGGTDVVQPYVVVLLDGSVLNATHPELNTTFKIQTTITQRNYDI